MSQLLTNKNKLQNVLNILENKAASGSGEQATPVISVSSNGLITATAGVKSSTYQLAFQAAKTITPSIVSQVAISSGYYAGGDITVAAVSTQTKSITPTTAAQNVTPDSGKFLSKVTVNAIPNTYVQPSSTKTAATYTPTTTNQTIAAGTYLTGAQTIKGDSNLVASNIKSGVSIFGVNGTLEEGSIGGEKVEYSENEDAIINRSITSYSNDRATSIGSYAFGRCSKLTTVNFPACTSIYGYAFYDCSKLTTVNFSACTSIGDFAFYNCDKLTTVSFPMCTSIGMSTFAHCSKLTTVNLPVCTFISSCAFRSCPSLITVSFPTCTSIGGSTFGDCTGLTTINLPVCTYIGGSQVFYNCRLLSSLTLGASAICTLSHSNVFAQTPFKGYSSYFSGTPHIYVPASLVSAYQSATNWVYFSSYFSSIESLLITFTINGETHQAEIGMTWENWVQSKYNTDGFIINYENDQVLSPTGSAITDDAGNITIKPTDEIGDHQFYYFG